MAATGRFFERAIDLNDVPASITIDKSCANTAAVRGLIADSGAAIELGSTIAHGLLVLSLLTSWHLDCVEYPGAQSLVNYGFGKLRFTAQDERINFPTAAQVARVIASV